MSDRASLTCCGLGAGAREALREKVFVLFEEHCGVRFRVDLEVGEEQHRAEWSAVDLARLDVMARVDQLLVVGCRVG